jgi:hypothetical protein
LKTRKIANLENRNEKKNENDNNFINDNEEDVKEIDN